MIRNNKRGLSDIVTNVLIILLVLVAVGILWAFLQPTIQQGAGGLEGAADCLTIDIEPVECSDTTGEWLVTLKRNYGAGDLVALKLVVDNNGATTTQDLTGATVTGLGELETQTFTVTSSVIPGTTIIKVAPVVGTGANQKTCRESTQFVTCN